MLKAFAAIKIIYNKININNLLTIVNRLFVFIYKLITRGKQMTKTISKNLNRRIQLLRESTNWIQTVINNGYKIDNKTLTEHKQLLTVCKELLRKELTTTNVKDLL